jgi:hypothetical protein
MEKTQIVIDIKNNALKLEEMKEIKKKVFVISKVKRVKNWTDEEDEILMKTAEKYDFKNWNAIAEELVGRSAIQCSARYKRIRPGIIKGSWTDEEDKQLIELLKKFGKNWSLISKYMTSRSGKQIRDRFLNALDPALTKDKFTNQEDLTILKLYAKMGSQWSKIATYLPGRTGDMIKNRFYSSLRKQIHSDDYREGLRKKKMSMLFNLCGGDANFKSDSIKNLKSLTSNFLSKKRMRLSLANNNLNDPQNKFSKLGRPKKFKIRFEVKRESSTLSDKDKTINININNFNQRENKKLLFENKLSIVEPSNNSLINNILTINTKDNDNSNELFKYEQNNQIKINNTQMRNEENQGQVVGQIYNCPGTSNGPTHPNNLNIAALNQIVQQNILNNFLLLSQENNLMNFNVLDFQMTQLLNLLLQQNFSTSPSSRSELETQLTLMRQMLNFTYMKLDFCKRGENPSETPNHQQVGNMNETISNTSSSPGSNLTNADK